jgi:DNA polymerase-1
VVSTDRDAFQLVTDNVVLMMTPRGVADVNVYTPDRVEARYGIRPDQIPDFIGLKGDTSDNIPGVPGIGDKTGGQLIAQYGSLEEVLEHTDELSPARRKNITEHAEQARRSKELATMRRDLELNCDPAELGAVAAGPFGASRDVPALRVPQPARARRHPRRGRARQAMRLPGTEVAGARASSRGERGGVRSRSATTASRSRARTTA